MILFCRLCLSGDTDTRLGGSQFRLALVLGLLIGVFPTLGLSKLSQ
jgi:hypothetical protein